MRNYPAFPRATPHQWAGSPRVPHPSATGTPEGTPFDLHALGTPPALILSQDQTLHQHCFACPVRKPAQGFVPHVACVISLIRTGSFRPAVPRKVRPGIPARRSSIFGRPVDSAVRLPSGFPGRPSALSGNQPVKVLALSFHAKTHPSSEGRLIYHVSKTDVKARLRGLPIPQYSLGPIRNGRRLDARRARIEYYHRSLGNARRRLPALPFQFPPEWCFRRRHNCRPDPHRQALFHSGL